MKYLILGKKDWVREVGEYLREAGNLVIGMGEGNPGKGVDLFFREDMVSSPHIENLLREVDRVMLIFPQGKWQIGEKLFSCPSLKNKGVILIVSYRVYGKPPVLPATEDTIPSPQEDRGWEEYFLEASLKFFAQMNGYNPVILRCGEVFGPGIPGIIGEWIEKSMKGEEISLPEGKHVIDLVYIQDFWEGLNRVLTRLSQVKNEVLNLSSGRGVEMREVLKKIFTLTGKESPITFSSFPHPEVILSPLKMRILFNWSSRYDWRRGLELTVDEIKRG